VTIEVILPCLNEAPALPWVLDRIWLTFGVLASSALALLRGRAAAWTLAGCAGTALLVNHLFDTGWWKPNGRLSRNDSGEALLRTCDHAAA
jgi:hypothetical protein